MAHDRLPATQNERRQNADVEAADFVRTRRKGRNLPNSWDDLPRARGSNSKPKSKNRR